LGCWAQASPAQEEKAEVLGTQTLCDHPDADPWVQERRDHLPGRDEFVAYATSEFGPPSRCHGEVETESAGLKFGYVELDLSEGVTFRLETMPPEISIATLRVPVGFKDEEEARRLLADRATRVGLEVDWTTPEVSDEAGARVEAYWDPNQGLNGQAALIFREDRLVAVRFSIAP
jgi:hypothetical protein